MSGYIRIPDPAASFRFLVQVGHMVAGRFTECSGLEFTAEIKTYEEGGLNSTVHQLPGRFKFSPVTLKKGVGMDGAVLWDWVKQTVNGHIEAKDVTVILLDPLGFVPIRIWTLHNAYPTKWSLSGIAANATEIVVEELQLAHQGMDFAQ
ncbi:MAG: phage tail protein [Anaerolineae bacterium]